CSMGRESQQVRVTTPTGEPTAACVARAMVAAAAFAPASEGSRLPVTVTLPLRLHQPSNGRVAGRVAPLGELAADEAADDAPGDRADRATDHRPDAREDHCADLGAEPEPQRGTVVAADPAGPGHGSRLGPRRALVHFLLEGEPSVERT